MGVTLANDYAGKVLASSPTGPHPQIALAGLEASSLGWVVSMSLGNFEQFVNGGKLSELHLPCRNYSGLGTKLKARLLRGDAPEM